MPLEYSQRNDGGIVPNDGVVSDYRNHPMNAHEDEKPQKIRPKHDLKLGLDLLEDLGSGLRYSAQPP